MTCCGVQSVDWNIFQFVASALDEPIDKSVMRSLADLSSRWELRSWETSERTCQEFKYAQYPASVLLLHIRLLDVLLHRYLRVILLWTFRSVVSDLVDDLEWMALCEEGRYHWRKCCRLRSWAPASSGLFCWNSLRIFWKEVSKKVRSHGLLDPQWCLNSLHSDSVYVLVSVRVYVFEFM